MAIWLVRAGSGGEYENKFLSEEKVYLTWDDLDINLTEYKSRDNVYDYLFKSYPDTIGHKPRSRNNAAQIWAFSHRIKTDDWVVLPSKKKASIHFGKVISDYKFDASLGSPYYHYRQVEWFATDIPRSRFDQDILYSLGAFLTICQIKRNDAEKRIKAMANNGWQVAGSGVETEIDEVMDIEQSAIDAISKFLIRKFKGYGMERIIDAILRAQGFSTYMTPEGADKGVDILAATGPLGFGQPRICVQVKTSDNPVERPVLDQLIGTMQNVNADQGLLVSWSGFRSTVDREVANQFFRVRLWDEQNVVTELLKNYDKLDEELKAEIPLKKIWILTPTE